MSAPLCILGLLGWTATIGADTKASSAPPPVLEEPGHPALRDSDRLFPSSNLVTAPAAPTSVALPQYEALLDEALRERAASNRPAAEKLFVKLLQTRAPAEVYKTALLELAVLAHEGSDLLKAQQIYAQFLRDFPGDRDVPEVLLRQGLLYREMGAPVMGMAKFYAVMSSALSLKLERVEYYQRLVLRAQAEIADTFFLQGKHEEAAEFLTRLLKLESAELDRPKTLCKLIHCLAAKGAHAEVVTQANLFLDRYPESAPAPEVRYLLSTSLNKLGRNDEARQQVIALLQTQEQGAVGDPQTWNYWRQRTGNDLANQFYQQADFANALQIYACLANLSSAPEWQLPALYQAGLVYERLRQTDKAVETYGRILETKLEAAAAASPSLSALREMTTWRKAHLVWLQQADQAARRLLPPAPDVIDHE